MAEKYPLVTVPLFVLVAAIGFRGAAREEHRIAGLAFGAALIVTLFVLSTGLS